MTEIVIKELISPASDVSFLNDIVALHEKSQQENSTPYLYSQDVSFFERNLTGECLNSIALVDNTVIGYAALRRMDPWPSYLTPVNLPINKCGLMLINLVDPKWRGKGVGRKLCESRLSIAEQHGINHLFSTVHPENTASMQSLIKLGFTVLEEREMFEQKLRRCVLYLDLTSENKLV
ncbi:GNAT family N-acetyltransferase [Sessilibacter corallicola]|uniref:GNAT family N-acetyltransferase n=1 Tax=Sessilibacter corallicola TaxID=2904075 RepID=UPI001E4CBB88|nr:GNAT family N-acetyltransferase [Sessilibacter corallicola]MCE2027685.1 GNAT family N-acetyltransferase [Sessilibacter corallicola]